MNWYRNPIGEHAGIVWRTLCRREMSWDELLKATKLDPLELACAIGWLARENKMHIRFNDQTVVFSIYQENYL